MLVVAGGAGVIAALAAACGGARRREGEATGAAPQGQAAYLVHQAPGPRVEQYKKLAAMYQQRNPRAQIEILFTPQGESHPTKLIAMAAAGTPPETTFVAGYNLVEFAERGLLEPLDQLVARDGLDMRRFFEKTVELARWTVNGRQHLFAIPLHPNPAVLFYNKDLFARRGVKAPDGTWTWETLLETARKLTGPDESGVEAPYEPISLWMTVRSMGGDLLDKDWKRYTLDQPAGVAAIQWIADLALRHGVAVRRSQVATRPFTQGKVGIKWDIFPTIESISIASRGQFAFDVAPVPRGPRGRINRNVIGAYGLLAQSQNKPLGWDWLKFLSTKEAHLFMANDGAVFPALKDAARSPEFLNPPPPAPPVNRRVFLEALEQDTLVQDPYIPTFSQIQSLVTRELAPVWEGEKDARTVLQAIAPQVNALLGAR
jgi:multiple sugar transport system substrate-binding protein